MIVFYLIERPLTKLPGRSTGKVIVVPIAIAALATCA